MSGKREIVSDIMSAGIGISKGEAEQAVNIVFSSIKARTEKGEHVQVRGFGTFEVVERKEKKGRNPQTGEDMMMAAFKKLVLTTRVKGKK